MSLFFPAAHGRALTTPQCPQGRTAPPAPGHCGCCNTSVDQLRAAHGQRDQTQEPGPWLKKPGTTRHQHVENTVARAADTAAQQH